LIISSFNMDSGSPNPLQHDSPQPCSPSTNNSDPLVQNPVELCPPSVNQHALISSPSTRHYEIAIGIQVFPVDVPSGYLILVLDREDTLRDFTYAVVVDQQLQNKIDDLQVYVRHDQSVVLGKGVYKINDMLTIVHLLYELAEQDQSLIFSSTLWIKVGPLLIRELQKELETYQELLWRVGDDVGWVVWEYRYSIAVHLTGHTSYRQFQNGTVVEATLKAPRRGLGGFHFRFSNLDDLFVPWEDSGQINCRGLFFEPNTFRNLPALGGWSAPVPHPSLAMEHKSLLVIRPRRELDAEKALGRQTVQAELRELKARVGQLERLAFCSLSKCRTESEIDDESGIDGGSEIDDESEIDGGSEIDDESESTAGSVESGH
jgi:hypothetical protein